MNRRFTLGLALAGSLALAAPSLKIDGQPVTLPTINQGGKVYVDAQALAKALGASVSYDARSQQLVILTGKAPAGAQGNGQLAGSAAQPGQTYAVGKRSPLNFTLRSAGYSVRPVHIGDTTFVPEVGEKLLVLRYSVQNPRKEDVTYYWGSLRFTAVDPQDRNHSATANGARDGTPDALQVTLKPAQKVDAVAVIKVPAGVPIPKLLVERGEGDTAPILRFDLRGKVAALPAPFADPADRSGASARDLVPASVGTFYPAPSLDLKVESVAFTAQSLAGRTPASGQRFLVATVSVKNTLNRPLDYAWGTLRPELRGPGSALIEWNSQVLGAAGDGAAQGQLRPGESRQVRFFYEVPRSAALTSLTFREGYSNGRAYIFDLRSLK